MTSAVDERRDLNARLASVRAELAVQRRRLEAARSRLRTTMIRLQTDRPQYELVRGTVHARLHARLDTEPVIEQAKGIVMAWCRCGPDEAFDLLNGASQLNNVPVSVIATRIVKWVAAGMPSPGRSGTIPPNDGLPLPSRRPRRPSRQSLRQLSPSRAGQGAD